MALSAAGLLKSVTSFEQPFQGLPFLVQLVPLRVHMGGGGPS